jgi:hypothetical protein
MQDLKSWTDYNRTRFYSGVAFYEKDIDLQSAYRNKGATLYLDFGAGIRVPKHTTQSDGMRTWLESPIHEAALVYVNGILAGSVWRPPYRLEITNLVKPGRNHLKLIVANLAINELAGRAQPRYRLLNARYGERFTPEDMQGLRPLPAGVLGTIRVLVFEPASQQIRMKDSNESSR